MPIRWLARYAKLSLEEVIAAARASRGRIESSGGQMRAVCGHTLEIRDV